MADTRIRSGTEFQVWNKGGQWGQWGQEGRRRGRRWDRRCNGKWTKSS